MTDRLLAGRYELDGILGQGGMASVYRAHDRILGRDVAVKLLSTATADQERERLRFMREARAAASLSHPGIVTIFDVGEQNGSSFIVMELIEGESLDRVIAREGPFSPADVVRFGRQIATALEYAHRRGVLHRDVKPHNVLVGSDGRARLVDFGIARTSGDSVLTGAGLVLGSAAYMAPERARGQGENPISDLYSLGVLLYELASGRLPFEGETPLAVALRHVEGDPPRPSKMNPSVPEALDRVILRAMAREPADRYGTAAELDAALATIGNAAQQPTAPWRSVPAAGGSGRSSQPRAGASVGQPAATVVRRASPSAAGSRARSSRRSSKTGVWIGLMLFGSVLAIGLGLFLLSIAARPTGQPPAANAVSTPTAPAQSIVITPLPATRVPAAAASPSPAAIVAPTATRAVTPTTAPSPTTAPPPPTATPLLVRVAVPRVTGLPLIEAQQQLAARTLTYEVREISDPARPVGIVLEQSLAEGSQVPARSTVLLTINRPASVVVPNVGGLEEAEARTVLQREGLTISVDRASGGRKGVVNDQSPQPGVRVPQGSVVTIVIGS